MKQFIKNSDKKTIKNGFTLIELLVVVLIIGILAAIAVPQYQKAVEKTRSAEAVALIKTLYDANELYFQAHGKSASSIEDLDVSLPSSFTLKETGTGTILEIWKNDKWDFAFYTYAYYFTKKNNKYAILRYYGPVCASGGSMQALGCGVTACREYVPGICKGITGSSTPVNAGGVDFYIFK